MARIDAKKLAALAGGHGRKGAVEGTSEFDEARHPRVSSGSTAGQFTSGDSGEAETPRMDKQKVGALVDKKTGKGAARKAEVLGQSTPAQDVEHYHGTDLKNLASILKSGIKPTDKSFGAEAKTAWAATNPDLAHAYASGSAASGGSDQYAIIVFKSGKGAGLQNFKGNKSAGYSFDTIKPDRIDRVEIHRVGSGKDDKPVKTLRKNAAGKFEL